MDFKADFKAQYIYFLLYIKTASTLYCIVGNWIICLIRMSMDAFFLSHTTATSLLSICDCDWQCVADTITTLWLCLHTSSKDQLALNLTVWWRLLLLYFQQGAQSKVSTCFPSITPAEEQPSDLSCACYFLFNVNTARIWSRHS